tara:strand:- start:412 stop:1404 length:993 start_codon:yes stop_codon:yes gene_type:complete
MAVGTVRKAARILAPLLTLLAVSGILEAQSFRGEVIAREALTAQSTVNSVIGAGQVLLVTVEPDSVRFFDGITVEVAAADGSPRPGSFSVAVYGGVDTPPDTGFTNLAGRVLGTVPIGRGTRQRILVPVHQPPQQPDAGTQVTSPLDPNIGALAIQLVPVTKGMDATSLQTTYSLTISPRLRPVGALQVTLEGDAELLARTEELLSVTLDGEPIAPGTIVERAPGIYRLEARAGDYLDYTSNVGIDQGRLRSVPLEPREPRASVRLSVPSVAEVYWDGELITRRGGFEVPPGEHGVTIRLGDFSVSRQVILEANQGYEVGIDLDILFKRD